VFRPNQRCPFHVGRRLAADRESGQGAQDQGRRWHTATTDRQKCASDLVAKALMSGAYSCRGDALAALAEDSQKRGTG